MRFYFLGLDDRIYAAGKRGRGTPLLLSVRPLRYQDRARIVFDCRMGNDPATINRESTNENNTDVDRWADARGLRINGKPYSNHGVASTSGSLCRIAVTVLRLTRYALALDD